MTVLMDFMCISNCLLTKVLLLQTVCVSSFKAMSSPLWFVQIRAQLFSWLRSKVSSLEFSPLVWKPASLQKQATFGQQVSGNEVAEDTVAHGERNAVYSVHSSSSEFGISFGACFVSRIDVYILMVWPPCCVSHEWLLVLFLQVPDLALL